MADKDNAEYEQLVREQLTQLGYNSEAIPDDVRAHFFCKSIRTKLIRTKLHKRR